jgi:DNA-directed RNA polymerase specialized sigma24 family protein
MTGSVGDAEDVVQDAFLGLTRARPSATTITDPKAYLTTVVSRLESTTWVRRLSRAAEAAGELETAAALAHTEGERRLLRSRLLDVRPEPA